MKMPRAVQAPGQVGPSLFLVFFHPDCTVGSGFSPDLPLLARGLGSVTCHTAGRESAPEGPTLPRRLYFSGGIIAGHRASVNQRDTRDSADRAILSGQKLNVSHWHRDAPAIFQPHLHGLTRQVAFCFRGNARQGDDAPDGASVRDARQAHDGTEQVRRPVLCREGIRLAGLPKRNDQFWTIARVRISAGEADHRSCTGNQCVANRGGKRQSPVAVHAQNGQARLSHRTDDVRR